MAIKGKNSVTTAVTVIRGTAPEADPTGDRPEADDYASGPLAMYRPISALSMRELLGKEVKVKHVGGSLPPLFPRHPQEGSARFVKYVGMSYIDKEQGQGSDFDIIIVDVVDPKSRQILFRAQHAVTKGLSEYFGVSKDKDPKKGTGPLRDEKTPPLVITYSGQLSGKENGRSGMKLWRVEEILGFSLKD